MKKLIPVLVALFVLVGTSVSYAQSPAKATTLTEFKVKVTFHCANGKALIEKELIKTDGIKKVSADLETKVVTVSYDSNKTNREKIIEAIEKIGYYTEFTPKDKKIEKACSHGEQH